MLRAEFSGPERDDLVDHRDHPVIGLVGVIDLAALYFGIGFRAIKHGEIVDAVAAPDIALAPRRQLVVERKRASEQFFGVGEHVLVEIDAAEIVQAAAKSKFAPVPVRSSIGIAAFNALSASAKRPTSR